MSQIENLISPSPVGFEDPLNEFSTISSKEEFFLFFPSTTGLNKPKKSRGFPTFESAQSAGNALNLMEGKHDRIFVIISSKHIKAFTPETGEIPFSNDMFRFSRLNSGAEKFKPKAFQENSLDSNPDFNSIPRVSIPTLSIDPDKSISDSLLEAGFNKDLLIPLQNLIQAELGISKLDHNPSQEELNSLYILMELLGLKEANEKIFQVIVETMKGNFDLSLFNL